MTKKKNLPTEIEGTEGERAALGGPVLPRSPEAEKQAEKDAAKAEKKAAKAAKKSR